LGEQKNKGQQNIRNNSKEDEMKIASSAFGQGESIPAKYTCDGENINPPLSITEVPSDAKSLAIIVDDPDAPSGNWLHWLVWNIPPSVVEIKENSLPAEAIEGKNDFGQIKYSGPCPPTGEHRYFFKVLALDVRLTLSAGASLENFQAAIQGRIIDQAELMGTYRK